MGKSIQVIRRMRSFDVILYTRHGCHLCDEASAALENHGLRPTVVDIDADPQLVERYGQSVPVVWIDGQERFRGRVDEVLLRRLLSGGTENQRDQL